jgi:hypothetical protein
MTFPLVTRRRIEADAGWLQFAARLPVSWPGLARPPMSLLIKVSLLIQVPLLIQGRLWVARPTLPRVTRDKALPPVIDRPTAWLAHPVTREGARRVFDLAIRY